MTLTFKKLFSADQKEQMINHLVNAILLEKNSYEDAIDIAASKMEKILSKETFDDLVEHICVDHTNYYEVAKRVAAKTVESKPGLKGEELEEELSDFDITRYDLPENFVKEYLPLVEFNSVG